MTGTAQSRMIEDSAGRKKLTVSLSGGIYQLSLDDRGVALLCNDLGYGLGEHISNEVVCILVAIGDAWFPHQRDYESVLDELPETNSASESERRGLAAFLRSIRVPEARIAVVRAVVEDSPLSDRIDPAEIDIKELPPLPPDIFEESTLTDEGLSNLSESDDNQ